MFKIPYRTSSDTLKKEKKKNDTKTHYECHSSLKHERVILIIIVKQYFLVINSKYSMTLIKIQHINQSYKIQIKFHKILS